MKTSSSYRQHKGFTLVEMLVTITIILILAGLSLGAFSFVTAKQARSKAELQIKILENGLEEYKSENGAYPVGGGGVGSSNSLFRALYWDAAQANDGSRVFIPDLNPDSKAQGWVIANGAGARVLDPWGGPYFYQSPGVINPDFDLRSAGPDGQTNIGNPDAPENQDDITNY